MEFSHQLFLLFAFFLPLIRSDVPIYLDCSQNMTENGIWLDNSDVGLKAIMVNAPSSGYAISTVGNGTEAFYGLAQCRGDISSEACSYCIDDAIKQLRGGCPESESVRIWYELCFLRFQSTNFFGSVDVTDPKGSGIRVVGEEPLNFETIVWPLLNWVKAGAAATNKRFGMGKRSYVNYGRNITVYGMAYCTPDLDGITCMECLEEMSALMESFCLNKDGCFMICSSCGVRFSTNNFLRAVVPDYSSSAPSPSIA